MINIVVWLLCGAIVAIAAAWRWASSNAFILLCMAAGTLGALSGGVITFIFDTTPLHSLSLISVLGALAGAVGLVVVACRLSHTTT